MEENSKNNKIKISASECLSWEYAEWKIWPCFFNTAYEEKDVCNESLTLEKKLHFYAFFQTQSVPIKAVSIPPNNLLKVVCFS